MNVLFLISLILLFLCIIALFKIKKIRKENETGDWVRDINKIAANHNQTNGVLAGVCITILVLLSTFRIIKILDVISETTAGFFLLAFFGFVAASLLYALVAEHRKELYAFYLFSTASIIYFLSVVLCFSALSPLLEIIKCQNLKPLMFIIVYGSIIGGYLAVSIPLHDLLKRRINYLILLFIIALLLSFSLFYILNNLFKLSVNNLFKNSFIVGGLIVTLIFISSTFTFYANNIKIKRIKIQMKNILNKSIILFLFIVTSLVLFLSFIIFIQSTTL